MALNGIDISNWQSGINLAVVPCDFVVIKATEGTGYVNPDYERAYRQAKTAGKCLGIYHYASGGNIQAEAEYFLKNAGSRVGEAMLVLDWEGRSNPAFGVNDREWVKAWCNYISTKTSVNPVVYVQQSMMSRLQNIGNYGLWVAQYASMEPIGYQENPWNEGAYACVMRQYSSSGRLSGWNGNLDLNKFYGDRQAWSRYAGKGNQTTPEKPSEEEENQEGTTLDLVFRTMRGEFGNGEERKSWLGTRYGEVQGTIFPVPVQRYLQRKCVPENMATGKCGKRFWGNGMKKYKAESMPKKTSIISSNPGIRFRKLQRYTEHLIRKSQG